MGEKLEESVHHVICGAFCHNLIDDVISRSSRSLDIAMTSKLKSLWQEKLHFNIYSHNILSTNKRKHWRLSEECEKYPHSCSSFAIPDSFMEIPLIDFNRGAQLEYVSSQVRSRESTVMKLALPPPAPLPLPLPRHQIVGTHCSIPFRGCCVYLRELSASDETVVTFDLSFLPSFLTISCSAFLE
jgi:hypothetical protein